MGSDLSWLRDLDAPLLLHGSGWRSKQKALKALPKWLYEPEHEGVRALLLLPPSDDGSSPEIPAELVPHLHAHLKKDPVAFVHFCAWYKHRETRKWKRGELTPGQLVILWRFALAWTSGRKVRFILLKQRRGGFTLIITALMEWIHFFRENRGGMQVAHDKETAQQMLKYLTAVYERLPESIRPASRYSTKNNLTLAEGDEKKRLAGEHGLESEISVQSIGKAFVGTGSDVQAAHCTEIGKWDKQCDPDVQYASITNTIPEYKETFIFLESTAHGANTWFHSMWKEGCNIGGRGWNGFTPIFIPWYFDPRNAAECPDGLEWGTSEDDEFDNEVGERSIHGLSDNQLYWRRLFIQKQKAADVSGKVDIFRQEYPGTPAEAWLFAGGRFINISLMKKIVEECLHEKSPIWTGDLYALRNDSEKMAWAGFTKPRRNGALRVWQFPVPGAQYVIGGDISTGQAEDASCLKGYMRSPDRMEVAFEWYGMILPHELAGLMWRIGHFYNTALLAWERTGPGMGLAALLRRGTIESPAASYPISKMYRRRKEESMRFSPDQLFGIETSGKTKRFMLDRWIQASKEGRLELLEPDVAEAAELEQNDRGTIQTHGKDRFMSSVMAVQAHFTTPMEMSDIYAPQRKVREGTVEWAEQMMEKKQEEEEDDGWEVIAGL